MSADGAGSLLPLTGAGQDDGGGPSFALLTADASGGEGALAIGSASFEALTADSLGDNPVAGDGAAVLEVLAGSGYADRDSGGTLEQIVAAATGLVGTVGTGLGTFEAFDVSGAGDNPIVAVGTGTFQALTASARDDASVYGAADVALQALQAQATGLVGVVGAGSPSFEYLAVSAAGDIVNTGSGTAAFERLMAYARAAEDVDGSQLVTYAMNTRNNAVTRYPAYPANSFARYNGTYLCAGPDGIFVMDADDALESTADWVIRTGATDDRRPELKRLTEVLLGLRYSAPIRVKVFKDEDVSYEYPLPNYNPDVLHQARVKVGKGLRSRYYRVEVGGTGGEFELDSLQLEMPSTKRRVG